MLKAFQQYTECTKKCTSLKASCLSTVALIRNLIVKDVALVSKTGKNTGHL